MVELYDGKAVAEQNSLEIAWELLLETSFKHLRKGMSDNYVVCGCLTLPISHPLL